MNVGRRSLRLGGLLALAAALMGCMASLDTDETAAVDEAIEELSIHLAGDGTEGAAEGSSDTADHASPSGRVDRPVESDVFPDPLPWRDVVSVKPTGCDDEARSGPDPLPWIPTSGASGSPTSSPGSGSKHD